MNTPNLFTQHRDAPTLVHNGTSTSKAAAETKQRTGSADTDRNKIAVYLFTWKEGATRAQLAEVLNLNPDSVRPRVCELIEAGIIRETGEVRVWNGRQKSKVLVHHTHGGTR